MGLDMYLFKRERISMTKPSEDWDYNAPDPEQAYYESTKHKEVWEMQTVKQWRGEETLHNYFCRYANYEIGPAPLRITRSIATKLLEDINIVLDDHSKAKDIFPTECAPFNFYGCEEDFYEEEGYLDDFITVLSRLKPMVEQILKDLDSSVDIYYEYDCWY